MSLRRSARLKESKAHDLDQEQDSKTHILEQGEDPDLQDAAAGSDQPPRKRARITNKGTGTSSSVNLRRASGKKKKPDGDETEAVRPKPKRASRKAGKLVQLLQMPLDVLYQIFGYLQPLDLLRVGTLNKAFYGVVMSRSARSVWINALSNAPRPPPPCPDDMNEIAYTRMLFDSRCWFCKSLALRNAWPFALRVRFCRMCALDHELFLHLDDLDDTAFHLAEAKAIPFDCGPDPARKPGSLTTLYSKVGVDRAVTEYKAAVEKGEGDVVIARMSEQVATIRKHASECRGWQMANVNNRDEELSAIRTARKRAIIQRLVELGWGDEIDMMSWYTRAQFERHKHMRISKKLTERSWEKIKDDLVAYMELIKYRRLNPSPPLFPGIYGDMFGGPYGMFDDYDSELEMLDSDWEDDYYHSDEDGECIIA